MLVIAPSGTGKSHLARSFNRVLDGDDIIASKVGWPPREWWKEMAQPDKDAFLAKANHALTPFVHARDVIVVVAFYSLWRSAPKGHVALATNASAEVLYLNSIKRRALNPRSVQPRYLTVDEAAAAISKREKEMVPRDFGVHLSVAQAAAHLVRPVLPLEEVGFWHAGPTDPGSTTVLVTKGSAAGMDVVITSSGGPPTIVASGDDARELAAELVAQLGPSQRRVAQGVSSHASEERAKAWLVLFDRYGGFITNNENTDKETTNERL